MALVLSSTDQARLAHATQRLLSPLDYEHVDDWRRDATRSLKRLLGADMGTFMLPLHGATPIFTEDFLNRGVDDYPEQARDLESRFNFSRRAARLQVFDRERLFQPALDDYYASSYYHDYIVPRRAFDCIGAWIHVGRQETGAHCALLFHHDSEQKRPFGTHGLGILRLVLPAFRVSVDTFSRLHRIRSTFTRTLDGIGEAIILFDRSGKLLHMTPRASELLRTDRGPQLGEAIARVVRGLAAGTPLTDVVTTSSGGYAVRGSYAGEQLLGGAPGILVTIEPPERPVRFDEERLRERFQLTRQETRVALLLVERMTNAEIAETLCISPHTARHHTERVLGKLGISSRKEVAAVLERAMRPPVTNG